MKLSKSGFLAFCAALICAVTVSAQEDERLAPLPVDTLFAQPNFGEVINHRFTAKDGMAPVSGVGGIEIGEPAPTFRTLQEAAQAGVNPLSKPGVWRSSPSITIETPKASRPVWPAVFGGLALLACGFVVFGSVLAFKRSRQAEPAEE